MTLPLASKAVPPAAAQGAAPGSARARIVTLAAWAVLVAPAWLMLGTAHAMWATYSPTPFSDQWSELFSWRQTIKDGWLNYLFMQHNEHRILFPRLVFLADLEWLRGRDGLNIVVIGLTQLVGAAFFVQAARTRRPGALELLGAAVALSLLFSLMQWENLFWGFQVQFVGVYAMAAWGLYAFCRASREPQALSWPWLATAVVFLVFATFNMANGVLAGVAMAAVAIVTRRGLVATAAAGAATAALLALYLHGYHAPGYHAPPSLALHHPGRFATYVAAYLGNIWCPGRPPPAALVGLVGMAVTAAMLVVVARDPTRDPARAALFGLALFVGLSSTMTSLGRLHLGIGQALSSRYMTPTAYFWAAHAVFWTRHPPPVFGRPGRLVLGGALGLALVRLIMLQADGYQQVQGAHERVILASSALLGGIADSDAQHGVYPNLSIVRDVLPFLQRQKLSLFADPPPAVVGARFTRAVGPANLCRGAFDSLGPAPATPADASPDDAAVAPPGAPAAWRAQGWGWDLAARRSISRVVLTDDAGAVLGIGLSGIQRDDVKKAVRQATSRTSGWVAAMNRGGGHAVIAYGITAAGPACELGRKAWPQ